jgi:hypothetical protein
VCENFPFSESIPFNTGKLTARIIESNIKENYLLILLIYYYRSEHRV